MNRIAYWLRPEDYDAFKRLFPGDPDLPDTFDEWLDINTNHISKHAEHGVTVEKMFIYPDEYAWYCRASNADPNHITREALAVAKTSPGWRKRRT